MSPTTRRFFSLLSMGAIATAVSPSIVSAQPVSPTARNKVVFQMSDSDPMRWELALNNLRNLQADLGADEVDLELVAYGPGIAMLKLGSAAGERVAQALKSGVKVVACENTMKGQKLGYADMLPGIGYVPAGVVELMRKQQQGYAYIRP